MKCIARLGGLRFIFLLALSRNGLIKNGPLQRLLPPHTHAVDAHVLRLTWFTAEHLFIWTGILWCVKSSGILWGDIWIDMLWKSLCQAVAAPVSMCSGCLRWGTGGNSRSQHHFLHFLTLISLCNLLAWARVLSFKVCSFGLNFWKVLLKADNSCDRATHILGVLCRCLCNPWSQSQT